MSHYSNNPGRVRIDLFKDTGKWYATGSVIIDDYENWDLHAAVLAACTDGRRRVYRMLGAVPQIRASDHALQTHMTQRRINALRNLVERGATEGEREAARRALEVQLGKREPPKTTPFTTSRTTSTRTVDYATFVNEVFRNAHYPWTPQYQSRPTPPEPSRYEPYDEPVDAFSFSFRRSSTEPKPKPPPVTQLRNATVADFPDAEQAIGATEHDFVRVEVATAAEMHRRFGLQAPFKIMWHERVYDVDSVSGWSHDRSHMRFYLHVRKDAMKIVQVPA